jgi:hypothetical protein
MIFERYPADPALEYVVSSLLALHPSPLWHKEKETHTNTCDSTTVRNTATDKSKSACGFVVDE